MVSAGIVLLTWNGEKYLKQTLEMIARQKLQPEKVVAIDSGSTDTTLEILNGKKIETHNILNEEFSHSRTRNLGVSLLDTRYIVFLTQDATPADNCWLDQLLAPFQEVDGVAGVFSRQIPRPGSDLLEANDLHRSFPAVRQIKKLPDDRTKYRKILHNMIRFSNSSAGYDGELLRKHPFDKNLSMAEDQEWAKRMLEMGLNIVYEPHSVVLHSHDHSLNQKYERNLEMGKSFGQFLFDDLGPRSFPFVEWLYNVYSDGLFISSHNDSWRTKLKWLSLSPLHRAAMHYAYYKGWNRTVHRIQEPEKIRMIQ